MTQKKAARFRFLGRRCLSCLIRLPGPERAQCAAFDTSIISNGFESVNSGYETPLRVTWDRIQDCRGVAEKLRLNLG